MNSHASRGKPQILVAACFYFVLPALSAFSAEGNSVETLRQTGRTFAKIAEQTAAGVVGIQSELTVESPGQWAVPEWPLDSGENFFDWFFRQTPPDNGSAQPRQRSQLAQGSGFIIDPQGYIITNVHLVGKANSITVQLNNDQTYPAKVIGSDFETDIALIKIDAPDLKSLELADSDKVEVGEWVLAIGNPFGLSHSVTAGIVSAKNRTGVGLAAYEDFLQTDAAINLGNSGGPLVNLEGQVIGVNTAIISRSGGNLGIGLAIPSNMVKYIYEQLLKEGEVVRGYLGVSIQDLTPSLAKSFGVEGKRGVLIPGVTEDSAAARAGIQKGDIILSLGGEEVTGADQLRNKVALYKPGTKVDVQVLRDGQTQTLTVEIGKRPSEANAQLRPTPESEASRNLGLVVRNLTPEMAERLDLQGQTGVLVTQIEPASLAAEAGLQPGMLITEVNRKPVSNTRQFARAVNEAMQGDSILLLISSGQVSQYVSIDVPKQ